MTDEISDAIYKALSILRENNIDAKFSVIYSNGTQTLAIVLLNVDINDIMQQRKNDKGIL